MLLQRFSLRDDVGLAPELAPELDAARPRQASGIRHPASGDDGGPSIAKRTAKASVTREPFPRIIEGALKDHSHRTHPRDASAEDHREMLEASM